MNTTDYNTITEKFAQHKKNFAYTDSLWLNFIKQQLGDVFDWRKILDYGCWNGNNASKFSALWAQVLGVDISESLLVEAQKHENNNLEFVYLSEDFSFQKESFDGAYSTYVTCVLSTQKEIVDIFSNIYSALKPWSKFCLMNANREEFNGKRDNGFKCIYTDNLSEWAPITTLLQYKEGDDDSCFIPVQDFFYSKKKYSEMLESSWFNPSKITTSELFQTLKSDNKTYDEVEYSPIFVITAEK
jgi:SAM-dependent methyltransferase